MDDRVARDWQFRLATLDDAPTLHDLIAASVRILSCDDYTEEQMEGAIGGALGLETQLTDDGSYFIVEREGSPSSGRIIGCSGWSWRRTFCCGDSAPDRDPALLDPTCDAAKIRAIFVHLDFARRGVSTHILHFVERRAIDAGFRLLEMGATVTGAPLYRREDYVEVEWMSIPLPYGAVLPVVRMCKSVSTQSCGAVDAVVSSGALGVSS